MWQRFWHWLSEEQGWKPLSGLVYLIICVFDFVIVPSWIGLTRPNISQVMKNLPMADVAVQIEYLKVLTAVHSPYTLQGGGLFHLAFGALLTGSAIVNTRSAKHCEKKETT